MKRMSIACMIFTGLLTLTVLAQKSTAPKSNAAEASLGAAIHQEEVERNFEAAIAGYKKFLSQYGNNRRLAAEAQYRLGLVYQKFGKSEARNAFEQVVNKYPEQTQFAAEARQRLADLGDVRPASNGVVASSIWTDSKLQAVKISPDGRYLAGSSKTGIGIHDISLKTDRFLGSTDGDSWSPCFTPDSKRIVYVQGKDGVRGGLQEIRVINLDGTGMRPIWKSTDYSSVEISAISADGKLAAVNLFMDGPTPNGTGWWQIGLLPLETGIMKILTTAYKGADVYVGNFSPDGRWLVYTSDVKDSQYSALYAIAVDGSDQPPLESQLAKAVTPFFSPDGSRVLFENRGGLYSIRVADGKRLGDPEILNQNLSSGGTIIGFTRDGSLYLSQSKSQYSIYIAEVDASTWKLKNPPKEISTPFRQPSGQPAWAPKGKLLAFEDKGKLVIHDFDSGRERELPISGSFRGWFPDGKSVLLSAPLPVGVRVFDTETRHERPLSLPDTAARNLTLQGSGPVINSTDGKYLFYFTNDDTAKGPENAPVHLIRRDLETNDEKELYRFEARGGIGHALAVSPDGRNLSFTPGVTILVGNEPRTLPLEVSLPLKTWTPDGKALLFVRSDEIWVQPVDGGPAYWTGIQVEGLYPPNLHPDGNRIAFLGRKNSSTVWKLQNLFPVAAKK